MLSGGRRISDGKPIPGREFTNAVPLVGDVFRAPVVWKGHDALGVTDNQSVILRFRMDRACLYGVDFL